MKRFMCFLILFAVFVNLGYNINSALGGIIAGVGFGIAYFYGEKW